MRAHIAARKCPLAGYLAGGASGAGTITSPPSGPDLNGGAVEGLGVDNSGLGLGLILSHAEFEPQCITDPPKPRALAYRVNLVEKFVRQEQQD